MTKNSHIPVMLNECLEFLNIREDGTYLDATLGRGNHAEAILSRLTQNGLLIGIDQDQTAISYCNQKFCNDKRVTILKDNFCNLKNILMNLKINSVDGILIDLGVSSPQLDNPERGFSYKNDGPLDMRMDQTQKFSAYDIINKYSLKELNYIFRKYGEILNPNLVSAAIIKARLSQPITSTLQLVEIIRAALPKKELQNSKHFARCYFQALRITVNNELDILKQTIKLAASCLNKNGRLAIITFHSLEDKIVIKSFQELSQNKLPKEVPINNCLHQDYKIINIRPIVPCEQELVANHRARSAKLRILMKC